MTSNKFSQYKTLISSNFIVFCELSLLMISKSLLPNFGLIRTSSKLGNFGLGDGKKMKKSISQLPSEVLGSLHQVLFTKTLFLLKFFSHSRQSVVPLIFVIDRRKGLPGYNIFFLRQWHIT